MSLIWGEVEDEIIDTIQSSTFKSNNDMYKYLIKWGNRVVTYIAQKLEMREHFQTCTIAFTTSDQSKTLPSIFLKKSERFTRVRVSGAHDSTYISIIGLDELFEKDPDRDETTSYIPSYVAIEGDRIHVYPLFTGTLILENYIRKPVAVASRSNAIDLTYDTVLPDLIISGVSKRCYEHLQDFDMAKIKEAEFIKLLYDYEAHNQKTDSWQLTKIIT